MSPYRILKLKSGESVITKIVGKKNGRLMVENPMLMKVTSLSDPWSGLRKEVLTLQNWLEYSDQKKIAIPEDWIALFLTPDSQASKLYETEIDQSEVSLEDLMKKQKEQIDKMKEQQMDLSQIMMSFAMDENMFKKLVEDGILEDMENEMDIDDLDGSHDDLQIEEPPRSGDEEDRGNHWRDWSPDLRDYL
tara:strand:+ start:47 stop:619 length:573 start_codon:yes stop_codon:yes gene_type:complete